MGNPRNYWVANATIGLITQLLRSIMITKVNRKQLSDSNMLRICTKKFINNKSIYCVEFFELVRRNSLRWVFMINGFFALLWQLFELGKRWLCWRACASRNSLQQVQRFPTQQLRTKRKNPFIKNSTQLLRFTTQKFNTNINLLYNNRYRRQCDLW